VEPAEQTNDNSLKIKAVFAALIVGAIAFAWFGIRTQVGNMLGELTSSSDENAAEVAQAASKLAPGDPRPKLLEAVILRQSFSADDADRSVSVLEDAVRRSPSDFRMWIELARGYEQAERYSESENALKKSIELAPSYAIPHWQMGNFLLRQDRVDEAKIELKKATETSSIYRDQVYALAWDYFGKVPARVEELTSDSADAQVNLANFYSQREAGRDSLRIWNTLSSEQKKYYEVLGKQIALQLYHIGSVGESLAIARDIGLAPDAQEETVNNGGFEKYIGDSEEALFGWKIFRNDSKFEALPDSQVRAEGLRSLKVTFRNYIKPDLYNVAQLVTVSPGVRYRLTFKVRTDNLRSGGGPYLEVLSVKKWARLAASDPFPIGSVDWTEYTLEFAVPDDVEGVELRTVRVFCGVECPIAGSFWYDDFRLVRLN
jgi:hypothetical protein